MKRLLLLLLMTGVLSQTKSQFVHKIKADSVLITNDSCTAELNLENSTKHIKGFLFNKGNGRTEFRKATILNDSTFVFGEDTLVIRGGGNFANTDLTFTANRLHNANHHDFKIQSLNWWQMTANEPDGPTNAAYFFKLFPQAAGTPIVLQSSRRNVANTSDSVINSFEVLGYSTRLKARVGDISGIKDATIDATANTAIPRITLTASLGSISNGIYIGTDSIKIRGAIAQSTADTLLALGTYNIFEGMNPVYKIPSSAINKNLANSQLRATVNVAHNWAGNNLNIDSIGILSLIIRKTRINAKKITTIFADGDIINPISFNYRTRNTADNADSMFTTMNVDANHAANIESQNISFSRSAKIQVATGSGIGAFSVINIMADTVRIKAKPQSTADSIFAVGPYNSTLSANALYKIPVTSKLIISDSASNVSQVDIVLNPATIGNWDRIEIQIEKLRPVTDNVDWWVRFSNNNGSTFFSGAADYEWISEYKTTVGNGIDNSGGDSKIVLVRNVGNASAYCCDGTIKLFHPFDAGVEPKYEASLISNSFNSGRIIKSEAGGRYIGNSMVTAIRILASSGNIGKIKYRIIGYKN